ncbi:VOC family protein [Sporosarcina sp. E16_8]|uniref:VOC family protein n=1 Tax=Sporosarcina sp. E16_8 TaxID=2789295 RepID=UPI001A91F808|nr:VOC family protein [Sporosarcina sp. E16_8]MBO0586863.1 hypothetical protein [Sporosarcina sp. E16_8]
MEIKQVILHTKNVLQMKKFYIDILGFSLLREDNISFRIATGSSELEFVEHEAVDHPFYHFAFNIPANKFKEAKLWTKERINLAVEDNEDEVYFENLDAHALYFYDPAGNIVEFIARHSVSEESSKTFSINSILNIGEMSLTVNDSIDASNQLNEIGVHERDNEEINRDWLNFMGEREKGIFLLLNQPGRKWLFSDKKSMIFPLKIILSNDHIIIINSGNELEIYPNGDLDGKRL